MSTSYRTFKILGLLLALLGGFFAAPPQASAANSPAGTCTWDGAFSVGSFLIVSTITDSVSCALFGEAPSAAQTGIVCNPNNQVAKRLFESIANRTGDGSFNQVLNIAFVLYILFYGIAFTSGIVQLTLTDLITRLVKIGAIYALAKPGSWITFYDIFVTFFKGGMDWLIGVVTGDSLTGPFQPLDAAISKALSAHMFVTIVATIFSGPYGLVLGFLLLTGLGSFVGALLQAIWVYLMALVVMAFLFGLGPIFLAFLLFSKTRHLFDGWLNQLINAMLQPVFLFMFFSFFVGLVLSAITNILYGGEQVCYMPSQGFFRGLPTDAVIPRFTRGGQPYGGSLGWADPIPISVFDILTFLILTQLTWRFNGIVLSIAREIASASTSLNMSGAVASAMNPGQAFSNRASAASDAMVRQLASAGRNAVAEKGRQNNPPPVRPPVGSGPPAPGGGGDKKNPK